MTKWNLRRSRLVEEENTKLTFQPAPAVGSTSGIDLTLTLTHERHRHFPLATINTTGGRSQSDLRYQTKNICFPIFTNNVWSCPLWRPAIVREVPSTKVAVSLPLLSSAVSLTSSSCPHSRHSLARPPHGGCAGLWPAQLCLILVPPHHEPFGCFKKSPVAPPTCFVSCGRPQRSQLRTSRGRAPLIFRWLETPQGLRSCVYSKPKPF